MSKLDEKEILAKVTSPTEWMSSMVVVMKPNKLRI